MEEEGKHKRKKTSRKKRSLWILRPFGRFANPLSSDSSDSDYVPDETITTPEKSGGKRKRATDKVRNFSSEDRPGNRRKKSKQCGVSSLANSSEGSCFNSPALKQYDPSATKSFANWNEVPTELIVKVFRLLTQEVNGIQLLLRCGMTCKQWHNGSKHPSLWKNVDLSFMSNSTRANDKTLKNLLKEQGENITSLILSNWKKITTKGMIAISKLCPNLETLGISGCQHSTKNGKGISADSIVSIINQCQLKNVDFSWFKLSRSNEVLLSLMKKRGGELLSLNLCCSSVQSNVLNIIMDSCRNLQILDISNTCIYSINIEKLQENCPKLQELYIAKSNLTIKSSSRGLKDQTPCFQDLVALSLQCDSLTDEILTRAVKNSLKLKLLDLRTCRFITLQAIVNIEAPMVEQLFLSHACDTFSLHRVLEKWGKSLYELDLQWTNSHGLDNRSLEDIAATGMKFSAMKRLDLAGTAVQDEGLRFLLEIFPNLESLNLTSCKGVSRGLKHKHDKVGIEELRKKSKVPIKK